MGQSQRESALWFSNGDATFTQRPLHFNVGRELPTPVGSVQRGRASKDFGQPWILRCGFARIDIWGAISCVWTPIYSSNLWYGVRNLRSLGVWNQKKSCAKRSEAISYVPTSLGAEKSVLGPMDLFWLQKCRFWSKWDFGEIVFKNDRLKWNSNVNPTSWDCSMPF